tara:strand:+ start:67 stop:465 length:399 start_codon:yes stop_codon:yes gene_type:complete
MDLEILNIASDTNNSKIVKNHTHYSKLKNSICGDEIKIQLIIRNNKIIDFGYQENSCIYCKASASLLSKISINNLKCKVNELCDNVELLFDNNLKFSGRNWLLLKKLFKKENISRKECILLPFKTLKKIVSK